MRVCTARESRGTQELPRIRVLVVEGYPATLKGLRRILEEGRDIQVVGNFESVDEVTAQAAQLSADVVVMGPGITGTGFRKATRELTRQMHRTNVLALTMYRCDLDERLIIDSVSECVYMTTGMNRIVEAVHDLYANRRSAIESMAC